MLRSFFSPVSEEDVKEKEKKNINHVGSKRKQTSEEDVKEKEKQSTSIDLLKTKTTTSTNTDSTSNPPAKKKEVKQYRSSVSTQTEKYRWFNVSF